MHYRLVHVTSLWLDSKQKAISEREITSQCRHTLPSSITDFNYFYIPHHQEICSRPFPLSACDLEGQVLGLLEFLLLEEQLSLTPSRESRGHWILPQGNCVDDFTVQTVTVRYSDMGCIPKMPILQMEEIWISCFANIVGNETIYFTTFLFLNQDSEWTVLVPYLTLKQWFFQCSECSLVHLYDSYAFLLICPLQKRSERSPRHLE